MPFPATRMRRMRATAPLRGLARETELAASHLVYPMFVVAGGAKRTPIPTMPGIDHLSIDGAVEEAGIAHSLGIPAVLLFGLPAAKDELGPRFALPEHDPACRGSSVRSRPSEQGGCGMKTGSGPWLCRTTGGSLLRVDPISA